MSNNSIRGSQNMKEKYNLLVHEINALVENNSGRHRRTGYSNKHQYSRNKG